MRSELEAALRLAKSLTPEALPEFLGELESVRVTALVRTAIPTTENKPDVLLTVEQAAARMNCSPDYLYRNHKKLPFTARNRVGRKVLFSSAGLDAYLRKAR